MNRIRFSAIIVVLCLILISSIITGAFMVSRFKGSFTDQQVKIYNSLRDKKIGLIKLYYKDLFDKINIYINADLKDENMKDKLSNYQNFFNKNYISNIIIVNKNFEIKSYITKPENNEYFTNALKSTYFDEPIYCSNFQVDSNLITQNIFYKVTSDNSTIGYFVFVLNNMFFSEFVSINEGTNFDIFNDEYKIIYSTKSDKITKVQIDNLTKEILNGNTGVKIENNLMNNYGFIDFKNNAIYINQYQSISEISDFNKSQYLFLGFIVVINLIICFVIISLLTKTQKFKYMFSSQNKDSTLMEYFGEHILDAIINIDIVIEVLEKLKQLRISLNESYLNVKSDGSENDEKDKK